MTGPGATTGEVTRLLGAAQAGDRAALDALFEIVYDELKRLARAQLRRFRPGDTLATTALVHDLYLRLFSSQVPGVEGRRHFFNLAARAMRLILVDRARGRSAAKRGGDAIVVDLDGLAGTVAAAPERASRLLEIDRGLERLGELDPRLVEVVELRFFAGLSVDEAAEVLGVSAPTVKRDTRVARAFLARELSRPS